MQVKNKLYKHHKSKFVLVMRNLSIAISGLLALGAIMAIPTIEETMLITLPMSDTG